MFILFENTENTVVLYVQCTIYCKTCSKHCVWGVFIDFQKYFCLNKYIPRQFKEAIDIKCILSGVCVVKIYFIIILFIYIIQN